MRIVIISDMHGNINALRATLKDVQQVGYDAIVCLGDVVAVGPQPAETLHAVRELDCPMIMGNHDEWLLNQKDLLLVPESEPVDGHLFRVIRDIDSWCRDQLSEDDLDYVSEFQDTYEMTVGDVRILFYHGSPRSNHELLVSTTHSDDVQEMVGGYPHTLMVGGHSHLQMIRRHHDKLLVNVGSVGSPFYFNAMGHIRNPWWAEYGIITVQNGQFGVELRRAYYDTQKAIKQLYATNMPHKDWWIGARDAYTPHPPPQDGHGQR